MCSDWKHWFQIKAKRYDDTAGVVVVAQFRNVFQWIEAMRMGPYHAPLHHDLDWKDFVTKTWTMPRYNEDLVFANVTKETCPEDIMCLYGKTKKPHDIIPCRANRTIFLDGNGQNKPRIVAAMYELRGVSRRAPPVILSNLLVALCSSPFGFAFPSHYRFDYRFVSLPPDDGSGLPFENILELRSAKIRNFLKVALYSNVKGFHPIRYEDMVQNGTEGLIRAIEKDLNVTAKCKPIKGEFDKGTRPLMIDYVDYMKRHVDWENEALIGYDSETLM